jgi:hypothetical protein
MLEPLNTTVLTSSSDSNLRPFSAFLKRLYIWKSHNDRFGMDSGWPNTFKRMESSMPWTVQATRGPPLWASQDTFSWWRYTFPYISRILAWIPPNSPDTKKLNGSSVVLLGRILPLKHQYLIVSHSVCCDASVLFHSSCSAAGVSCPYPFDHLRSAVFASSPAKSFLFNNSHT